MDAAAYLDGFVLLTSDRKLEYVSAEADSLSEYRLESSDMPVCVDVIDGVTAVSYRDRIVAVVDGQELTVPMEDGLSLVDVDARGESCYAITEKSQIIRFDMNFTPFVFDFNAEYSDYYGEVRLTAVAVSDDAVCVCGVLVSDGTPVAFVSTHGNVWSRRELEYSINGSSYVLENEPLCATYSASRDAFVLGCREGILFVLPKCSHCNYPEFTRSGDVYGVAFNGDSYIAVGEKIY